MTNVAVVDGLRARKRRATENAIESSAVALAIDQGFELVTVEAICDRAEVSRSTFFNYFPSRDAAILGRPFELLGGSEADTVLQEFADSLPRGLFMLIFASIGHTHVNSDVLRMRAQLASEQVEARRAASVLRFISGDRLTQAAESWLRAHPDAARFPGEEHREAAVAVGVVYAAISVMAGNWIYGDGDTETGLEQFDAALGDLRTVMTD